ncbi:unnamed protein product [Cylicostephanus goldi]|uniref:Uncharacterized protein n=1 Tax=Cylicostephanus goldi TaxID=71465 RepID=A0A3P6RTE0_CYLGO|nr:unnamed protein product [Cylicostephanus goldi]
MKEWWQLLLLFLIFAVYLHIQIKSLLQEEILNSSLTSTYDPKDLEYLSSLTVVQAVQYIKGNSPLIWVSINTYFAVLALIAKFVTKLTFKELTRQEEIVVRHGFLSFLMFSIVFLSVVAGAHQSHRILPWLVWFGIIGFMTVLHDIAYQRFKFVSLVWSISVIFLCEISWTNSEISLYGWCFTKLE